jgi:hypothetical protein
MNVIFLRGILFGKGRETECEILAWKNVAGAIHPYSQLRVVEAPDDLPDGEYTLAVDDLSVSTGKKNGLWMMVQFKCSS